MQLKFPLDYTGYLTVLTLWLSMGFALLVSSFDIFGMKPLSSMGVHPDSDIYFSSGLLLAAVFFIIFAHKVKDTFEVSNNFLVAVYIGQLSQMLTALIPYGGEQPERALHTISAFVLAMSIPLVLLFFAKAQPQGRFKHTATHLFWLELTAFILGIGLFVLSIGAAYAQALPAIAFHVWILYINRKYLQRSTYMKKDLS